MGWEGFGGKTTDKDGGMATAMIPHLVPRALLLLLAMASPSPNGAKAQSQSAATAAQSADGVDDYIKMKMTRQHIPGLTLAVIRDGKIVKLKGYGLANLELNIPAAVETVYPINSVTKQFAAAGVMILVEEGKVGLDDKISKYIDGTPEAWRDINVRHLLTHTSGLKDFIDEPTASLRLDMTDEEIFKTAAPRPLNFSPGEKFSYCNTGYHLLGMMIRKVTGKSYGEFLQQRIFDPLGMEDTRIISHSEIIPNRASGYLWNGTELQNGEYVAASLLGAANGGLRSTVLDLAKWDAALDEAKLIKKSSLEQMWTSAKFNDGRPAHYGFGWIPGSVRGHRYVSHTGGHWNGYSCVVTRFLDDHLTVVLLANQSGRAKPAGIAEGVARHYIAGLAIPRPAAVELDPSRLDAYTGKYEYTPFIMLMITREGRGLLAAFTGNDGEEIVPTADDTFSHTERDARITFFKNRRGELAGLTWKEDGRETKAPRLGPLVRSLQAHPDPDPELTRRVEAFVKAAAQGGKPFDDLPRITPLARKQFGSHPIEKFVGFRSLTYLDAQDASESQIERYGKKVRRILYYKLVTARVSSFLMIYLTDEGDITDFDLVDE